MNRKKALARLPEAHAQALRLRDRGLDDEAIGKSLGIPPEAVGPLLWVAGVKLAQLLSDTRPKP